MSRDRKIFSRTCRSTYRSTTTLPLNCIDVEFQRTSNPVVHSFGPPAEQNSSMSKTIAHIEVDGCSYEAKSPHKNGLLMSNDRGSMTCSNPSCRACILAEDFCDLDFFLSTHSNQLSKSFRSLVLRGTLEKRAIPANFVPGALEHEFFGAKSLEMLRLQRFAFNIHWIYWDIEILKKLSLHHLTSLKVPLGLASDSLDLGNALISMNSLRSLTITDMPDSHRFLRFFPILGLGILSRTGSLRELDLSITNSNRPDQYCTTWERIGIEEEPFEAPKSLDQFFKAFFPKSDDDVHEEIQQEYLSQKTLIINILKKTRHTLGPLKLEKLRLKRIDVPKHAFTRTFDGSTLTQLRIPYCDVHPAVWSNLSPSRVTVVEDVNYELLPGNLLTCLESQPSLHSLCFRRPADQYKRRGCTSYHGHEAPPESFNPWRQASPLGRGTSWGEQCCYSRQEKQKFPSLGTLLKTLSKTRIETLLLPADMYDVTPQIVRTIGIQLPLLKDLTWGFDYKDMVSIWRQARFGCISPLIYSTGNPQGI